jgi:hypothetical protein
MVKPTRYRIPIHQINIRNVIDLESPVTQQQGMSTHPLTGIPVVFEQFS